MTEDNICNYCKLRKLRAEAKKRDHFVRVRETMGALRGVNVYEVPDCAQFYYLQEGHDDHDKYFKQWFAAIPDHCVC